MRNLIEIYIASASTQRTVPAVAQAAGARTEKIATKAKDVGPPKTAATYTVASFSAPAAWPASQFVPATSSDSLPALTVAPFATRIAAAAPLNEAIKPFVSAQASRRYGPRCGCPCWIDARYFSYQQFSDNSKSHQRHGRWPGIIRLACRPELRALRARSACQH
jgi:hypothetical protein